GGDAEGEHALGLRRRRGLDGGRIDAQGDHGGGGTAELEEATAADGGGGGGARHGDSRSGAGGAPTVPGADGAGMNPGARRRVDPATPLPPPGTSDREPRRSRRRGEVPG